MSKGVLPIANGQSGRQSWKPWIAACALGAFFYLLRPEWIVEMPVGATKNRQVCSVNGNSSEEFDWNTLQPSPKLNWKNCYDTFECTRLLVPLDYHNSSEGDAAIALLRIPAKKTGRHYRGPVLINPGGPGGSGTNAVLRLGSLLKGVLGDEYDILGFDPRGIGYTTPLIDPFLSTLERDAWKIRHLDAPLINDTSSALAGILANANLFSQMMEYRTPISAKHSNTAVVARDMLSIVEAHEMEKLQYWGFSYGSVLGSTFASLFPERVGRLVIDGVVDVQDYYRGSWSNNLIHTDKGLQMAFEQCSESGDECGLYEDSASKVEARYYRILDSLEKSPVILQKSDKSGIVITKKYLHIATFRALYEPYKNIKVLFAAMKALEEGNGEPFYDMQKDNFDPKLNCNCDSERYPNTGDFSSGIAVYCQDGEQKDLSDEELRNWFEEIGKISQFADIWSNIRASCRGWKLQPSWEWRGPIGGNTSFPILLVGNTEDPVTPWAERMAEFFTDSVALIQKSAGHCSVSASSVCTARHIRDYFDKGILPAKNTVCEIESHMFVNTTEDISALSVQDRELMTAWRALSEGGLVDTFPLQW